MPPNLLWFYDVVVRPHAVQKQGQGGRTFPRWPWQAHLDALSEGISRQYHSGVREETLGTPHLGVFDKKEDLMPQSELVAETTASRRPWEDLTSPAGKAGKGTW